MRTVTSGSRVWLSAPLRSGTAVFSRWLRDGVEYDRASTTSVLFSGGVSFTAVYETPGCTGIAVYPGTDSLLTAVGGAAPGATFCIKAGTHRFTTSVIVNPGQRFIGEAGAILSGAKVLTGFVREGSYWVVGGQTQQEPLFPAVQCLTTAPTCVYPEKTFLDGKDLWQVGSLAELRSGTFYFDYGNDRIYLFDDPTGRTVETTTGAGGIVGFSGADDNVTVRNLVFEKFGGGNVTASAHLALKAATGWVVENNEFRLVSNAPVLNSAGSVFRNNHVHHNGKFGVTGSGVFEGNVISYNNLDGFEPSQDAGGSKFLRTDGLVVRGNVVSSNTGRGLWSDYDNIRLTYENNVIEDNSDIGIFHEVSCSATVRNNVLRGNNSSMSGKSLWYGAQIYARTSKDMDIVGNLIDARAPGVHAVGVRQDRSYTTTNCGTFNAGNIAVHGNVIRIGAGSFHGDVGTTAGYGTANAIRYFANTYVLADPAATYFLYDGSRPMTKEQWLAAGQDRDGTFLLQ